MKFDCAIANPPYAISGNNLHLKFVDKINEISNIQISVFPISFITKHEIISQDLYKEKFSQKLVSVEEVSSNLFKGTKMPNCGIYCFSSNKKEDNSIRIKFLNEEERNIDSLLDLSKFNNYENEIIKYLIKNGSQKVKSGPYHAKRKFLMGDKEKQIYAETKKNAEKSIPKNKVYLICNSINGGMNGTYFSSKVGNIIVSFEELIKYYAGTDVGNPYNIVFFNTVKEAENCKVAMKNPLLRLVCLRTQDCQRLPVKKVYKYVPAIDWADDRVKTDEGLLEVCGCPKDKCKEYADYCKKIIDEVDKI